MSNDDITTICSKIESLHTKILNSNFCEMVTESEMLCLILVVQELNLQNTKLQKAKKEFAEKLKEGLPLYCRDVVEGNDMQGITAVGYNKEDVIEFINETLKESNIQSES